LPLGIYPLLGYKHYPFHSWIGYTPGSLLELQHCPTFTCQDGSVEYHRYKPAYFLSWPFNGLFSWLLNGLFSWTHALRQGLTGSLLIVQRLYSFTVRGLFFGRPHRRRPASAGLHGQAHSWTFFIDITVDGQAHSWTLFIDITVDGQRPLD
jgi:hypothetical protein